MDKQRFRTDREYFYVADYNALPIGVVSVFVPRRGLYMLKVATRYIRQQISWVETIISNVLYQPPDNAVWDGILATIDEMEGYLMAPYERVLCDITLDEGKTYVTFTGIDYSETGPWQLTMYIVNPKASTTSYDFLINEDTSNPNYYTQVVSGSDTTLSATRVNNPITAFLTAGKGSIQSGMVAMSPDGYVTYMADASRYGGADVDFVQRYTSHYLPQENITWMQIRASQSAGIGAGSRFLLVRLGV